MESEAPEILPAPPAPSHPRAIVAAAGLLGAILALPLLSTPFDVDQALFSTLANTLLGGGVAYRDAWEHRPPGVFYAYYLSFLLFGPHAWAMRIFEIGAVAAVSAGLARLGILWFRSAGTALVAAVAFPLMYGLLGAPATGHSEIFQAPFVVWGIALWPVTGDESKREWRCWASGILESLAVCFKTPAVTVAAGLLVHRLFADRNLPGMRAKLRLTWFTAAGLLIPPLLIVTYYVARGAGPELFDALIFFPAKYAAMDYGVPFLQRLRETSTLAEQVVPLWAGGLVALGIARGAAVNRTALWRWAAASTAAAGAVILQGKFFNYHHIIVLPFVALGMGLPLMTRARSDPNTDRTGRLVFGCGAAFLLATTAVSFVMQWKPKWESFRTVYGVRRSDRSFSGEESRPVEAEVSRIIRSLSRPEDAMFVWGTRPLLYFMSERRMAGSYPHMLHMAPPWPGSEIRIDRLLRRLDREPPRLVVVCPNDWEWWCGQTERQLLDRFSDMREFIRDNYVLASTVQGCEIWTRRSP